MVDRAALTAWLRKQFAANRPWNEVVYDLVTADGLEQGERGGQLRPGPPRIRRRPADLAHDPALPRPADPVHPVPRPPLERLEAGRLLGHQRVLQGA